MTKPNNDRPVSVRLGELKPFLQQEAYQHKRSLHWWIKEILREYKEGKEKK
jgi:hypothetical protein